MPICARCGQPLDAMPVQRACPSCTWRAALRASRAALADTSTEQPAPTADGASADDAVALHAITADVNPVELMDRLITYATMVGEDLGPATARIYLALIRGNPRPYHTELNRLVSRFVDNLEESWRG
jgi:hypothetical protein